jgi:hypothetical protein
MLEVRPVAFVRETLQHVSEYLEPLHQAPREPRVGGEPLVALTGEPATLGNKPHGGLALAATCAMLDAS